MIEETKTKTRTPIIHLMSFDGKSESEFFLLQSSEETVPQKISTDIDININTSYVSCSQRKQEIKLKQPVTPE